MKTVRMKIEPNTTSAKRVGKVNTAKLDATTETQIAQHSGKDDTGAKDDAAKFAHHSSLSQGVSRWIE